MEKNKIIVFEKIKIFHFPYLFYLLLRGYKVFVFNFAAATGEVFPGFLKKLIDNNKVKPINLTMMAPHGLAIDQTDAIFKNMESCCAQLMLARLFQDDETELIFKKFVVSDIFKCIYVHSYLCSLAVKSQNKLSFIPDQYIITKNILNCYGLEEMASIPTVKVVNYFLPFTVIERLSQRCIYFLAGICLLLLKFMFPLSAANKPQPGKEWQYKYGVSISSEYFIKYKGKRGFNFLLDGRAINKKNTVFLMPYSLFNVRRIKKIVNRYRSDGWNFYILPNNRSLKGLICILKKSSKFFTSWEIIKAFLENKPFTSKYISAFLKSCNAFFQSELVFNNLRIKKYIYSNQESWHQTAFNIYLRNNGVTTFNYSSFIGGGVLYAKDSHFNGVRHILWSYLNSDHFFAVNDNVISYYKLHSQKIRHYHSIGSIYSELISEHIKDGRITEFLSDKFDNYNKDQHKLVSYFDTTFIDDNDVVTSFDDAIDSCQDLLKLLEDYDKIFLIIKPSKNEDFYISPRSPWSSPQKGQRIIDLWDALKDHPRVLWAGDDGDVTGIIAVSDLVITHCMSSPTLDALGSRKCAIWYESGNKHQGILYDQIPNLVCHGYNDLKEKVNQFLFHTTPEEYNEYLNCHILGFLEPHLDSQGLSRLRQHISA